MQTQTLVTISIASWFLCGYGVAKIKISIWQTLILNDKNGFKIKAKSWGRFHLFLLFIAFPSQISLWIIDKNITEIIAVPIIPMKLFTSILNRSNLNYSFLKSNGSKEIDFSKSQQIQYWKRMFILSGWFSVLLWFAEIILVSGIRITFVVIHLLLFPNRILLKSNN